MAGRILNAVVTRQLFNSLWSNSSIGGTSKRAFSILTSGFRSGFLFRPTESHLIGVLPRQGLTNPGISIRYVSTKQRRRWKIRKYHFKLRLKRTMRKMRVPYMSSKSRGQVKKKPILYDFRPYLRRKLKRAER